MCKAIVSINTVNYGSTGRIMRYTADELRNEGWRSYCAYGRYLESAVDHANDVVIGTMRDVYLHYLYARLTNRMSLGPASRHATVDFVRWLQGVSPDLIHLHDLQGYYINVEILFDYLRRSHVPVRWTLHSCWAFTGHCSHFTMTGCDRWKSGCHDCPQTHYSVPRGLLDSSEFNYTRKREVFASLPEGQLELLTPSRWLARFVTESFLSKYPLRVVPNRVDGDVFRPTPSDFRECHGIGDRFMVLGVARVWTESKGIGVFSRLLGELDPSRYSIVLVGLNGRQIRGMAKGIIGLPVINDDSKLAEIYSAADVFVHPGNAESFGMVVAEATACGTPAIVARGSACVEAASPGMGIAINPDMSTLADTIKELADSQGSERDSPIHSHPLK